MYVCMYVCVYICVYVYMYVCMNVCMYVLILLLLLLKPLFLSMIGLVQPGYKTWCLDNCLQSTIQFYKLKNISEINECNSISYRDL